MLKFSQTLPKYIELIMQTHKNIIDQSTNHLQLCSIVTINYFTKLIY